jgi:hypothetical protein
MYNSPKHEAMHRELVSKGDMPEDGSWTTFISEEKSEERFGELRGDIGVFRYLLTPSFRQTASPLPTK